MTDLQRLNVPNALYYVELTGNGHRPLFIEREGFSAFLDCLKALHDSDGAIITAYCLLQDSVHLVIQCPQTDILSAAQKLKKSYTQYAQQQWHHHGSIFHKHVHTLIVEPSRYLLPLIQQIHYRPVDMGLVAEASIYPWSSLTSYLSMSAPTWLDTDTLMRHCGLKIGHRRTHTDYLKQPPAQPLDWHRGNHHAVWALASDTHLNLFQQPTQDAAAQLPPLQWLTEQVCQSHHITPRDLTLRQGHRRYREIMAIIAYLAKHISNIEPQAACDYLQQDSELLTPLIVSLSANRGQYLHNLQLQIRAQWQQTPQNNDTGASINADQPPTTTESPYEEPLSIDDQTPQISSAAMP